MGSQGNIPHTIKLPAAAGGEKKGKDRKKKENIDKLNDKFCAMYFPRKLKFSHF